MLRTSITTLQRRVLAQQPISTVTSTTRTFSSSMMSLETDKELVDIHFDDKNVATLTLNNLPANSLSYEM